VDTELNYELTLSLVSGLELVSLVLSCSVIIVFVVVANAEPQRHEGPTVKQSGWQSAVIQIYGGIPTETHQTLKLRKVQS